MRRFRGAVPALAAASLLLAGCAGQVGQAFLVQVQIQGAFQKAPVGGAPIQITATLNNEVPSSGSVTWSIGAAGAPCSPACGTIAAGPFPGLAATYTPPANDPTGASLNPTITATSVSDPTRSASFSFKLETKAVNSFIFLLRGFDSVGSPMAMAGNLVADLNGNITGGELDTNDGHQIIFTSGPLSGSYTIDSTSGAVTRGTINLANVSLPAGSSSVTFKYVTSGDRSNGTLIEVDGNGFFNAGIFQMQDPAALGLGVPGGNYAFGLDSADPLGSRIVEAGQFVLAAGGGLSSGVADRSQAGASVPLYTAQPVSGSATGPDALGRGTLTLTVQGNSNHYAYYIVNSGQIDLMETGNGSVTVQTGLAYIQSPMNAASVNATSVLQLTGTNQISGTNNFGPAALIGLLTISGGSSLNLLFDSNNLGAVQSKVTIGGSIASFDPSTGRGTLSVTGGFSSGFVDSAVFYFYSPGNGFMIDTDPTTPGTVTNYGLSGTLTSQSAGPFSNASLAGGALLGLGGSPTRDVPNVTAAITFDSANETFSGTGSLTSFFKSGGPYVDQSFINATYEVVDTTNGYGTAVVPASLFGDFTSGDTSTASFYIIDTNHIVMIGTHAGSDSGVISYIPF